MFKDIQRASNRHQWWYHSLKKQTLESSVDKVVNLYYSVRDVSSCRSLGSVTKIRIIMANLACHAMLCVHAIHTAIFKTSSPMAKTNSCSPLCMKLLQCICSLRPDLQKKAMQICSIAASNISEMARCLYHFITSFFCLDIKVRNMSLANIKRF